MSVTNRLHESSEKSVYTSASSEIILHNIATKSYFKHFILNM